LLLVAFGWAGRAVGGGSDLERGFRHPPESARPWVYWFVMDGNFSREGITADFEALKKAGIGGVAMLEVDVGVPRGPVKFMSPEWRALFKHAVKEAKRLGLQITLNAGPGWTGSGGPWVKPEQSMQHLVGRAVEVSGPKHYDEVLPRPQRRPAFFGDGHMPPELEKAKDEFYRDEAVLAFPTPDGKERVSDIDEKALYVRAPYSSAPGVKPFLPSAASYPGLPAGTAVAADRIVDLTTCLGADGRLVWDVPEGKWTIVRFGRTSTGACTRPAPKPGLGLECDKMDPAALDAHFDAFVGTLLSEVGRPTNRAGAGWTMLHIDSWEMGSQKGVPATARLRSRTLPARDHRLGGGQPGGDGALSVGFAPDCAGVGYPEPRGALEGIGAQAWVWAVHRALRHDAVRRHELRRGGRCADVRVLAVWV